MTKWLKSWHRAMIFVQSASSRVLSGTVDEATLTQRYISCFGNPISGEPPCQKLLTEGAEAYCNACGCGKTRLARLNITDQWTKLHFPYLNCPLGRKGFSNYGDTRNSDT